MHKHDFPRDPGGGIDRLHAFQHLYQCCRWRAFLCSIGFLSIHFGLVKRPRTIIPQSRKATLWNLITALSKWIKDAFECKITTGILSRYNTIEFYKHHNFECI